MSVTRNHKWINGSYFVDFKFILELEHLVFDSLLQRFGSMYQLDFFGKCYLYFSLQTGLFGFLMYLVIHWQYATEL